MKLKKRMLSILLVLAVMITFMPYVTLTANAASNSKKVYTVKSSKNADGDSTKYTYNKKGFVTKAVSKKFFADSDTDTVQTVTTTFKYNKKNRITTKTKKDVETVTYYVTSKNTGALTGQSLGTVTTTTTDVTQYTYNKKGRATQAVTTSTVVKSGSYTDTDVSLNLDEVTELSNGYYIAGYNHTNADGSYTEGETSDNAYYYTGDINAAVSKGTGTTTYQDNGDGTYTETYTYETNSSNFNEKPKYIYYIKDESGKYVVCSESDYEKAEGERFTRIESVDVSVDTEGTVSSRTETNSSVITDQTVTTETFTYDKKKRVKQNAVSEVITRNSADVNTVIRNSSYTDTDEVYDEDADDYKEVESTTTTSRTSTNSSNSAYTEANSWVEKYTYNKKNRKTKTVIINNGVRNSVETVENGMSSSTRESSTSYKDGKTSSEKTTSTGTNGTTSTTVYSNGNKTVTTTQNPSSSTTTREWTNRNGSSGSEETKSDSTFFSNGGSMTTNVRRYSSKSKDGSGYNIDSTNTYYYYDETFDKYSCTETYESTSTDADGTSWKNKYSESSYNDGTEEKEYYYASKYGDEPEEVITDDAAVKATAESANKALVDSGTPYTKTESKAVKATPSTSITTYKYDKQGNLKSANTSNSKTKVVTLVNETYGNPIYEFNSEKELEEVEATVAHTYKYKRAKENTVKKGSNRVSSTVFIGASSTDRATPEYNEGGRVTYTLKAKTISKKAVRNDVELQQWMIQNPGCGSVAGLF